MWCREPEYDDDYDDYNDSGSASPGTQARTAPAPVSPRPQKRQVDSQEVTEGPQLSTVDIAEAYLLAQPPQEPRKQVEKGDTLWPRAPVREKTLQGRGSVYDFLASAEFKWVVFYPQDVLPLIYGEFHFDEPLCP